MTRSKEDLQSLLKSVDDTLSRPRPAPQDRWDAVPQGEPAWEPAAEKPAANAGGVHARDMDVMARGFGQALGETAKAIMARIDALEARVVQLEGDKADD